MAETYIIIEVHCVICKESLTPDECEMEAFRLGLPVHNAKTKIECLKALITQIENDPAWQPANVQ